MLSVVDQRPDAEVIDTVASVDIYNFQVELSFIPYIVNSLADTPPGWHPA